MLIHFNEALYITLKHFNDITLGLLLTVPLVKDMLMILGHRNEVVRDNWNGNIENGWFIKEGIG